MELGIGQTHGTCWFYSSLNMFLLSDNGLKILWQKLQKVYDGLGPVQKRYFESNINAPCPLRSVSKTSSIYFWKFLDEYLDRKSTRLNSSHVSESRMPSSA